MGITFQEFYGQAYSISNFWTICNRVSSSFLSDQISENPFLQLNEGSGKDSLTVKIITNLGIAQEARGLLVGACDSYR